MNKKEIELAIKNRKEEEVYSFFKNLTDYYDDKKCVIYAMITSGSGCDSPIISKDGKQYKFDSYGMVFKNWREWDKCFSYGACGTGASTTRLKCVANSCISFNRESGRVALISIDVYDDLKKDGYKVIKLKNGFR